MAVGTTVPPVPKRRFASRQARRALAGYLFVSPWIIGFLLFTVGAMLFSLGLTLFKTDLLTEFKFVGLSNFPRMFSDEVFIKSVRVTAAFVAIAVPLQVATALGIALLLNSARVKGKGLWRTLYYLPSIVSGMSVAILWSWILNPDFGLLNYGLGLVGIQGPRWLASEVWAVPAFVMMGAWVAGANMILYLAGLQNVPTQLYEAAQIDGANSWQSFRHITIPMISPTVFFNVVMSIIGAFQSFTLSYAMTSGGPNNATNFLVYFLYNKAFRVLDFGYASVVAWTLFCIIMVFTLLVVRSSALWVYYEGELRK
jgi:multiple sugar transport system permease protein